LATKVSRSKDAILAAALKVFARDGFDGASLPRIAELAGVAHPSILYHFRSKSNLWRETVDHAFGPLMRDAATLEAASRSLQPVEKLQVLIRAFSRFAAHNPDHFALIINEARGESERLDWLRETYADAFLMKLQDILRAAQQQGQIRPLPIEHLSFLIMGGIVLFFSFNFHLPACGDMQALADKHADTVMDVLLNGVGLSAAR
jgi:TetR/AcrR family transcriptional regulator